MENIFVIYLLFFQVAVAVAGATAVAVGHKVSSLSHSTENVFAGFNSGHAGTTTTTNIQSVNSNILLTGNLNITSNTGKDKEDNINIQEATIISNNITQQGLNINNTTTETTHEDIKPDYANIATSAAITGGIAGALIVGGEWISDVKDKYSQTTGRPVSQGPSTLLDQATPNAGFNNSMLGINAEYNEFGDLVAQGTAGGANKPVNFLLSNKNPLFQALNNLPGAPSFVDWHDAALEGFGQMAAIGSIPPFFALSQCVALGPICANFPDKFLNIGTGGLLNTNLNNSIQIKPQIPQKPNITTNILINNNKNEKDDFGKSIILKE
jgi:hypothetical protein